MDLWDDIDDAPDHQSLTKLNNKFRVDLERDTDDFTQNWCCPSCGGIFPPIKNLLVDLPAYGCSKCHIKNPACYKWMMTKTKINNIRLDFMVYNQHNTPYCALFAVVAAFDGSRRVDGAIHKIMESGPLDVMDMRDVYESKYGFRLGFETKARWYHGFDNLPLVLRAFRDYGITYHSDTICDHDSKPSIPRLHIRSFFRVDHTDVLLVTRLVASGFPLVTSMLLGPLFFHLKADQVYECPTFTADALSGHAVAIIGSGTAFYNGSVQTFYVVRNSHGEKCHSCHNKEGFGADYIVWAKDVRYIWGFYLPDSVLHEYVCSVKV